MIEVFFQEGFLGAVNEVFFIIIETIDEVTCRNGEIGREYQQQKMRIGEQAFPALSRHKNIMCGKKKRQGEQQNILYSHQGKITDGK